MLSSACFLYMALHLQRKYMKDLEEAVIRYGSVMSVSDFCERFSDLGASEHKVYKLLAQHELPTNTEFKREINKKFEDAKQNYLDGIKEIGLNTQPYKES